MTRPLMARGAMGVMGLVAASATLCAQVNCGLEWKDGNPGWVPYGTNPGTVPVRTMAEWDPDGVGPSPSRIVIGGDFYQNLPMPSRVAYSDGSTPWLAIPVRDGAPMPVRQLLFEGATIYIGGDSGVFRANFGDNFYQQVGTASNALSLTRHAGSIVANLSGVVHRWTGSQWVPLGSGGPSIGIDTRLVSNGNELWSTSGLFGAIYRWNGANWQTPPGLDSFSPLISGLGVYNGKAVLANTNGQIGLYNGSGITLLGTTDNGTVTCIQEYLGQLYVGGTFSSISGTNTCGGLAVWNGSNWSRVLLGISEPVTAMSLWRDELTIAGPVLRTSRFVCNSEVVVHKFLRLGPANVSISSQPPASTLRCPGDGVTLSISASANGAPLTYQWRFNGAPLTDGTRPSGSLISGTQGASLTLTNLQLADTGAYDCFISSPCRSNTSIAAQIDVNYQHCEMVCSTTITGSSGIAGVNGPVSATTTWDPDGSGPEPARLVISGDFTRAGEAIVNHIALWDGSAWQPLGNLSSPGATALGVHNGDLYAAQGGDVGLPILRHIGNGQWVAAGSPDGPVHTLGSYAGELIAGGDFQHISGVPCNRIAHRSGTQWQPFGSGVNGGVHAMVEHEGALVIGGVFTTASGAAAPGMARWNGLSWEAFAPGSPRAAVSALIIHQNELFRGVDQSLSSELLGIYGVQRWTGTSWEDLSGGTYTQWSSIHNLREHQGQLFAAGQFEMGSLAIWDGTTWSRLPAPHSWAFGAQREHIESTGADLIAAGNFPYLGDVALQSVARWDGQTWSIMGDTNSTPYGGIGGMAWLGDELFVTGPISAGGVVGAKVYRRDAAGQWHATPPPSTTAMNVHVLRAIGDHVYLGSNLGVHRWTGSNWEQIGETASTPGYAPVEDLAGDGSVVYAIGGFQSIGGVVSPRIAVWTGANWIPFNSTGMGDYVNRVVVHRGQPCVFSQYYSSGPVRRFNGSSWVALGSNLSASLSDAVVYQDKLIVCGEALVVSGTLVPSLAAWDGITWSAVPDLSGYTWRLDVFAGELYATGGSLNLWNAPFDNTKLARWNGLNWRNCQVPSFVEGTIYELAAGRNQLAIYGDFSTLGSVVTENIGFLSSTESISPPLIEGRASCDNSVASQQFALIGTDATLGRRDECNGSELDALYARTQGDELILTLAGNLKSDFSKLEIFLDTKPGGQNKLRGDNSSVDGNGLNRLGDDGSGNGLRFPTGFDADYWIGVGNGFIAPGQHAAQFHFAEILTGGGGPGFFLGQSGAGSDGLLSGGTNPSGFRGSIDNSNIRGVGPATINFPPEAVQTGVEVAVPLSAIQIDPCRGVRLIAFITNPSHGAHSGQSLPSFFPAVSSVRQIDMNVGAGGGWAAAVAAPPALTVTTQPQAALVCQGQVGVFALEAAGAGAIHYQWKRFGVPIVDGPGPGGIVITGATTPVLVIENIRHIFEGSITCELMDDCASISSAAASLTVIVGDFNCSGTTSVQDVFDYLEAYFSGAALADVNASGTLTVQDLFDFLELYFGGS